MIKKITTKISGLVILTPNIYEDNRGSVFESFNRRELATIGIFDDFVQDNHSTCTAAGTLRGLHFQVQPYAQSKLVRCVSGRCVDVVVDIRSNSETYGQHYVFELGPEKHQQIFIPEGCAHGYLSLEDNTVVLYKCSSYYSPDHQRIIKWDSNELNIPWGTFGDVRVISDRDAAGLEFRDVVPLIA